MSQIRRKLPVMMLDPKICDTRWLRTVISVLVLFISLSEVVCSHSVPFSVQFNSSDSDNGFKPIIPSHYDQEFISRNLFTETGQYRIFSPMDSDLRLSYHRSTGEHNDPVIKKAITTITQTEKPSTWNVINKTKQSFPENHVEIDTTHKLTPETKESIYISHQEYAEPKEVADTNEINDKQDDYFDTLLQSQLKGLESLLVNYLGELFVRKKVMKPGISVEIKDDKEAANIKNDSEETELSKSLDRMTRSTVVNIALPRAFETGRLFFFAGLKKILWPIFIGIQIIKSMLFALFLPSIIGSLGKIAGQGSSSLAGFNRPSETVDNLNFKDNFEDDSKFTLTNGGYAYNQPAASTNHFSTQLYDAAEINNNALSRYGLTDQRDQLMNTLGYDGYMKANTNIDSPLAQGYMAFKRVPASSLLLSNYDPFYSPLLSRLDSVFQQLGLKSTDENCREKLICSMYANPAKYAPYSNLVSAQLSRELDELRKPTTENAEILRFFKYMKAAKDGQDGVKCEVTYSICTEFQDIQDPAMINAYNDINKLVEARKLKN